MSEGHWGSVGGARMLCARAYRDDPQESWRSGGQMTQWIDIFTLYDETGRRHIRQYHMGAGVDIRFDIDPDRRWVLFANGGIPALADGPAMDRAFASTLVDTCRFMTLSHADRVELLRLVDGFIDPAFDLFGRILQRAVYDDDAPEQLRILLDFGVPINQVDMLGHNALSAARSAGKQAAIDYLLSRGAQPPVKRETP